MANIDALRKTLLIERKRRSIGKRMKSISTGSQDFVRALILLASHIFISNFAFPVVLCQGIRNYNRLAIVILFFDWTLICLYHLTICYTHDNVCFSGLSACERKSFIFLRKELPVRLANIMKEIHLLPENLLKMPSVGIVNNLYATSFDEIIDFEKAEVNETTLDKWVCIEHCLGRGDTMNSVDYMDWVIESIKSIIRSINTFAGSAKPSSRSGTGIPMSSRRWRRVCWNWKNLMTWTCRPRTTFNIFWTDSSCRAFPFAC